MSNLKELRKYSQRTNDKLKASDKVLPLPDDRLLEALPEVDDYTILTIDDGVRYEVIRAYNDAGELLIERGYGDTTPATFPSGSCVSFEYSGAFIADFVCQLPEDCKPNPLPNDCGDCNGCCD